MRWDLDDIAKILFGGGMLTTIAAIFAKKMDWIRFKKTDEAQIIKTQSETAINLAVVTEKEVSNSVKVSQAWEKWNIILSTQLEKAFMSNDKKNDEIDRLHGVMDILREDYEKNALKMKQYFEIELQKNREEFIARINDLEEKLEIAREELIAERSENWAEIENLKKQIYGND